MLPQNLISFDISVETNCNVTSQNTWFHIYIVLLRRLIKFAFSREMFHLWWSPGFLPGFLLQARWFTADVFRLVTWRMDFRWSSLLKLFVSNLFSCIFISENCFMTGRNDWTAPSLFLTFWFVIHYFIFFSVQQFFMTMCSVLLYLFFRVFNYFWVWQYQGSFQFRSMLHRDLDHISVTFNITTPSTFWWPTGFLS